MSDVIWCVALTEIIRSTAVTMYVIIFPRSLRPAPDFNLEYFYFGLVPYSCHNLLGSVTRDMVKIYTPTPAKINKMW